MKQIKGTVPGAYTVGCLDCKVDGAYIELVDAYRQQGWQIINSVHLDKPGNQFDVLVTTWTRLNYKRLKNVKCKAIVIRDNDEPDNVLDPVVVKKMGIPYFLIDNWGISTRVSWNQKMIMEHRLGAFSNPAEAFGNGLGVTIIGDTPSHDAMMKEWTDMGADVSYPNVPKSINAKTFIGDLKCSDVVIVHLGKEDFIRYWLDPFLKLIPSGALLISTTRGPLYSAAAMNQFTKNHTAVLDWAWEEDKLVQSRNLIITRHASYKSPLAIEQLTSVTTDAIHKALDYLKQKDTK